MNIRERAQKAKEFATYWKDKGYEKGQSQLFWIQLLQDVFEVENISSFIEFENQVHIDKSTGFIDAYIPSTKILIEQKSIDKDLTKEIKQADGSFITPFQQAKKYVLELPYSKHPRYVVTCNFKSFLVYDMEKPNGEPYEILLENLEYEYYRLQFLVNVENEHLKKEMEVSIKAGDLVGKLYELLLEQYIDKTNEESLKSLNKLCVRLVFCLYAEDSGLFGKKMMFHDYLSRFETRDLRRALIDLFKVLDTKIEDRDPYLSEELAQFPYVNGGLFANENIEIPNLNDKIKILLLSNASEDFDWSEISPTIFGAVFESTLNPDTRRSGGMHYTSIENIHKVIDPLFFDELNKEFDEINSIAVVKNKKAKLEAFQDKLSKLTFLDPACGSGNFLTETYLSLRKLENKVIESLTGGQVSFGDEHYSPIKVSISQFYGIEINDFAVTVATTALWIAESQMMKETENILHINLDFLPLKSYTNITEGNALKIDWNSVIPKECLNYIMGNPPFVGARLMTISQKNDLFEVYGENVGNIDFVSAWFKKASDYIKNTQIEVAFVSTNSICQGEQNALVWKNIILSGIKINFAYRTFKWNSEAKGTALVYCVIVGFSYKERDTKMLFQSNSQFKKVKHINSYLLEADDVFIEKRSKPLCIEIPKMIFGSMPNDGGNLIITPEEYEQLKDCEFVKKFTGAEEFMYSEYRYCIWLKDVEPNLYKNNKFIYDRVNKVKEYRLESKREATRKLANYPMLFGEIRQPTSDYLIVPCHTIGTRKYIPIMFLSSDVIASNAAQIIPNASLYNFGILTSNVHMAWVSNVCGWYGPSYRYSAGIVYNNFPWCNPTEQQKEKIEKTAQAILDARALYKNSTLADLYDELTMPKELRKAHQENDKAVMEAYGFDWKNTTESEFVAELLKMYQKLAGVNNLCKNKIEEIIKPYIGMTQLEIFNKLTNNQQLNGIPKNIGQMVTDLIFEKNQMTTRDFVIKNLPVDTSFKPLERMTFRTIKLDEFEKEWEESDWKKYFENLIMYVICYEGAKDVKNGYRFLKGIKTIEFNKDDLESIKISYNMVKAAIEKNDMRLLPYPGMYENQYLEVGPKGAGGSDAYNNFLKDNNTKVCFILNKKFLEYKLNDLKLTHNKVIKNINVTLNKVIYDIEELKIIFENISNEEMLKILKENGYVLKDKYVIKNELSENIVVKDNGNILKFNEDALNYSNMKRHLEAECKKKNLYKLDEYLYISKEKLEELGFTFKEIEESLKKIENDYREIDCFSIENVFENEYMKKYEDIGFAKEMFEYLLKEKNINQIIIGDYNLYSYNLKLNINMIFKKIILKYRILTMNEIKKILYSKYKIEVSIQKIRRYINSLDFYYNDIFDKVYVDKNDYYGEVYDE